MALEEARHGSPQPEVHRSVFARRVSGDDARLRYVRSLPLVIEPAIYRGASTLAAFTASTTLSTVICRKQSMREAQAENR